ncbi:MAG: hypothetical protein HY077_08190 [Elusimicrobia bacterium]|nr:hypothetical protein [Elusimicrobiota bacterium]
MSRRKAFGLLSLSLLPFIFGCIPEPGTQVSWSPSGRKVGFLSGGRPWIYDIESGSLERAAARLTSAGQLAWSSEEGLLAVSTQNVVELLVEERGRFVSSATFAAPAMGEVSDEVLSWNPADRRLLLVQSLGKEIQTSEIALSSGVVDTAPGVAAYGPEGDWTLWVNQGSVGHQERLIAAREGSGRAPLILSEADQATLGDAGVEMLSIWGNPLCFSQSHDEQTKVLCFDASGRLRQRAVFAKSIGEKQFYMNRQETLFAVLGDEPMVFDSLGKVRARGVRLKAALEREFPGQRELHQSNLAWSPDGNWLAAAIDGRLCLWNWRNDVVRVLPALE